MIDDISIDSVHDEWTDNLISDKSDKAKPTIGAAIAAIHLSIAAILITYSIFNPKKRVFTHNASLGEPTNIQIDPFIPIETEEVKAPTPYDKLECTSQNKKDIEHIVKTLATAWFPNPLDLNKRGDNIKEVHPLKFLEISCQNSEYKKYMQTIWKSALYKSSFSSNLKTSLRNRKEKGDLIPYVKGFCNKMKFNEETALTLIQNENWENLFQNLMNTL